MLSLFRPSLWLVCQLPLLTVQIASIRSSDLLCGLITMAMSTLRVHEIQKGLRISDLQTRCMLASGIISSASTRSTTRIRCRSFQRPQQLHSDGKISHKAEPLTSEVLNLIRLRFRIPVNHFRHLNHCCFYQCCCGCAVISCGCDVLSIVTEPIAAWSKDCAFRSRSVAE